MSTNSETTTQIYLQELLEHDAWKTDRIFQEIPHTMESSDSVPTVVFKIGAKYKQLRFHLTHTNER